MGLDRGSCELANNLFAAVAIRNAIVRGEKQFLVTVKISRAQAPSSPVISDGGVEVIRENIKVHKLAEKKGLDYLKI
jgi:hypothetical protein